MNSKIVCMIFLMMLPLFAHRVLIMVDDNADGTVTIETGLSSGGTASGSKLILTERSTGRPLWQGKVPADGVVTTKRPSVPYSVTLSMSEGHAITQAGPELLPLKSTPVVSSETVKPVIADSTASKIAVDSTVVVPADSISN